MKFLYLELWWHSNIMANYSGTLICLSAYQKGWNPLIISMPCFVRIKNQKISSRNPLWLSVLWITIPQMVYWSNGKLPQTYIFQTNENECISERDHDYILKCHGVSKM